MLSALYGPLAKGLLLTILSMPRHAFIMPSILLDLSRSSSIQLSFILDTSNWFSFRCSLVCSPQHDECGGTFCTKGGQFALGPKCPGGHCALGKDVQGDILHGGTSWPLTQARWHMANKFIQIVLNYIIGMYMNGTDIIGQSHHAFS